MQLQAKLEPVWCNTFEMALEPRQVLNIQLTIICEQESMEEDMIAILIYRFIGQNFTNEENSKIFNQFKI